jgi:hypothetical protein
VTDDPTWTDVTLYVARPGVTAFEDVLRRPSENPQSVPKWCFGVDS